MTGERQRSSFCRFRILTAPGPGAVAVLEISCDVAENAQFVLRRITSVANGERNSVSPQERSHDSPQPKSPDTGQTPAMSIGRICYGRWNNEDLIVVRTSVQTWEIQCHGGTIAVNRICNDLLSDGIQDVGAINEATSTVAYGHAWRAVPGGEAKQFESIQQIVHQAIQSRLQNARSRKTAGLILAQASNSLCDDLRIIGDSQEKDSLEATATRQRLVRWQDVALHLTEPWRVVFAGAPNVGKSSLVNAIAGMDRSIVCDQPGTTRDIVEVDTVVEGWPFRFVDTAGLRERTEDQIEELGIRQSHLAASQCDVLCLVFDHDSDAVGWGDRLSLAKHTVLVRNKSDLLSERSPDKRSFKDCAAMSGLPVINVSAHSGQGLPELLQWIKLSVVPHEPAKDTALPLCLL